MRTRTFFIRSPQHPLLRALAVVVTLAVLAALAAAGLVIGAVALAALTVAAGWRRWRQRRARDPDIIEGEFTVVPRRPSALPRPE